MNKIFFPFGSVFDGDKKRNTKNTWDDYGEYRCLWNLSEMFGFRPFPHSRYRFLPFFPPNSATNAHIKFNYLIKF